ncbi:hypothetical protein L9F63_001733, partial [Diploptera punctata]
SGSLSFAVSSVSVFVSLKGLNLFSVLIAEVISFRVDGLLFRNLCFLSQVLNLLNLHHLMMMGKTGPDSLYMVLKVCRFISEDNELTMQTSIFIYGL